MVGNYALTSMGLSLPWVAGFGWALALFGSRANGQATGEPLITTAVWLSVAYSIGIPIVAGWKHLTLHFLRVHIDATYRETVDWASEMDRVRAVLQLARSAFPAPSTLWRSFERVLTRVWRQLLDRAATTCAPGEHGALDATFFDRQAASSHYRDRSDRHIQTLKTTALVDTDSCAVLDLHWSAHWPHDTQVGRRVALRNIEKIESLAGDKGYDDQSLRDTL